MSAAGVERGSIYDVDGVRLGVDASAPAVSRAMDLRLRGFPALPRTGTPDLRLSFTEGEPGPPQPRGQSRPVYETPYGQLYYAPDADIVHGELAGVSLRCAAGDGVSELQSAAFTGRALYLATHPLATISLMELFKRRARYALHAGCVANGAGDGVLLAGPSGAGKSTLTFALAREGLRFLADDTVFLSDQGQGLTVLGFSDAIGVTEHTAARFPELRGLLSEPPQDGFPKRLRRVEELLPQPPAARCSPRVLVFPVIVPGPSRVEPMDGSQAFLRLVPDVLLTDPRSAQLHLEAFTTLLEQVDCYLVESGPEIERTASLIAGLL